MPRKRLLFIINDYNSLNYHRKSLAKEVIRRGYDLHIACPKPQEQAPLEFEAEFHYYPLSRKGTNPFSELHALWNLKQVCQRIKPDIVHNFTIKPVLYGSLAAHSAGVPLIINTVTGLGHSFLNDSLSGALIRQQIYWLYKKALSPENVRVIFQNPDDRNLFLEQGWTKTEKTTLVPGSGVNPDEFSPVPSPVVNRIPKIVYSGRLLWTKGVGDLAEASKILKSQNVQFELHLYGPLDPGNPAEISERIVRGWESEGLLQWHGLTNEMADTLRKSDIVCLPSYREGVPRSLLEASACEKPIVTTDVPGCREAVQEGFNGLLVPLKSPRKLAEALKTLIESPQLRTEFGKNGRSLVLSKFTEEKINQMVIHEYLSAEQTGH